MRRISWMAAVACLFFASSVSLADPVENPIYKLWSGFKVGSSRTMTGTMSMRGMSMDMELKDTLVELAADHATIESASATIMQGQRHEAPAHKQTFKARDEKKEEWREVGKEDVKAMGRTFHCRVFEGKLPVPAQGGAPSGGDITSKSWISDEVPGGAVQMKISLPQGQEITYLLKDFQVK